MWRGLLTIGLAAVASLAAVPASAADILTISECEAGRALPVSFSIDCTNVSDPQSTGRCATFLQNQACRVFPAYRKITGIRLEDQCRSIAYTIYDKDKWPEQGGEAGGRAFKCRVNYMTQFSVDTHVDAAFGPYDTHEILHEYHEALGAIPYQHILFGPSMAEATLVIGDNAAYQTAIKRMKSETATFDQRYQSLMQKGGLVDACVLAEIQVEEQLYLADRRNVYRFYSELEPGMAKSQADREARFNRMYDRVSGGTVRPFLLAHGCAPF